MIGSGPILLPTEHTEGGSISRLHPFYVPLLPGGHLLRSPLHPPCGIRGHAQGMTIYAHSRSVRGKNRPESGLFSSVCSVGQFGDRDPACPPQAGRRRKDAPYLEGAPAEIHPFLSAKSVVKLRCLIWTAEIRIKVMPVHRHRRRRPRLP